MDYKVFSKDEQNELNNIREKCRYKFYEILKKKKTSILIEESIYNYVIETLLKKDNIVKFDNSFKNYYMLKNISLYNNLNEKSTIVGNNYLLNEIKNNRIDLTKIAYLKPNELFPERWSEYIKKKKAVQDFLWKENKFVETDEYKCSKCKQKRCTYYTLQTRSCDEPETIIITCLNCNYGWKE